MEFTKEEMQMLVVATEIHVRCRENFYMHSIQKDTLNSKGKPFTKEQINLAYEEFKDAVELFLKIKEMNQ